MSDLKAVAMELLEKWAGAESKVIGEFGSPDTDLPKHAAEIAEYRARIEAAEPEPTAATTEPAP